MTLSALCLVEFCSIPVKKSSSVIISLHVVLVAILVSFREQFFRLMGSDRNDELVVDACPVYDLQ